MCVSLLTPFGIQEKEKIPVGKENDVENMRVAEEVDTAGDKDENE